MTHEQRVEDAARAIDAVQLFIRFNDWTIDAVPGLPCEICCHGNDDEDEIVVVERHPGTREADCTMHLHAAVSRARATAALAASEARIAELERAAKAFLRQVDDGWVEVAVDKRLRAALNEQELTV